ncbi:MAG: TIGR01458 family HAD-type hydrolase [Zetaproteobacteria bacterium CG12_big_fil_rev_8_21_14_0_65_55_1124]|nr:MAG: TIGR01458 family HAD-type hydrolase [Zetaproteobacteria bacterium CG08_land_8_20_14_0_20_55_17]PIW42317.1 MAG: TIGR01458 family HAD-type hydrolase [Zetaproteobacteria bacterium CG12_big_fil_rev_8_21_14_0_65_55_1124]PIY52551.1 MAG: TIGR01458 family HAD-type hydrolase [Zetaproteobacteria bacterium CG_4_10_14_0_8_um_filter_55_43]PIZ36925.1 MAG: TIGR01458 family HAD-type hydrolase [Zetaproteobacteria bacterium CG_4_10_14_0_2_um_filter_55_20]PJB80083.1 MAG: TIGR01458 family HAD-type hydrolas
MDMEKTRTLKAVLLDLDGVLYIGDKALPDAAYAVQKLRDAGYRLAGVTNTTTQSRRKIAEKLASMGFALQPQDIDTPAALAVARIGKRRARLFVHDGLREDFIGIHEDIKKPEVVVMGDIGGEGYPPDVLREIFEHVMQGAQLLALHKNRFWQKPDGLHIDLGAFVTAIEYATGQQAEILGKPSKAFFHGICKRLGIAAEQALMVGDDIEFDIGGARDAGLKTALVKTGKYRAEFVRQSGIKANLVLPSIADLPDAIRLL